MNDIISDNAGSVYAVWVKELKQRFLTARLRASVAASFELLEFYWSVGRDISLRQWANTYGSAFFHTLSRDMKQELPGVKGFSENNIRYIYRFYLLYSQYVENLLRGVEDFKKMLFSVPWFHHQRIIDKCGDDVEKAVFYIKKTHSLNWGRTMLVHSIDARLYEREGKAVTNFSSTLPEINSDLARQVVKDPYMFDFLDLRELHDEKELEEHLCNRMTQFLIELGRGFCYYGKQVRLKVDNDDYYIDLLFYNVKIHAYVVVELKTVKFMPEHLGQLGFYTKVVDHTLRSEIDNPTIGLLICRDKNRLTAQYALEAMNVPLGVAEYKLFSDLTADYKDSLPTIEEIEKELSN